MDCNNLQQYLTIKDFDCVANVAKHCDLEKLCIATEEAKLFDIIPLFCFDFVDDVLANWDIKKEIEDSILNPGIEKYQPLICGGNYIDNAGRMEFNMGFKKVWIYYSYARYLLINQFNDTANGTVTKQNEWSIPTPLKEVTDFSNKYRAMGREAYESVLGYLCANKEHFPKFNDCNCKLSCGCSGSCTCGKTKKLTGFKFKTVRK